MNMIKHLAYLSHRNNLEAWGTQFDSEGHCKSTCVECCVKMKQGR